MRKKIAVAAGVCAILISLSGSVYATDETQTATEAPTEAVITEAPAAPDASEVQSEETKAETKSNKEKSKETKETKETEKTKESKVESKTYRVIVDKAQTFANVDGMFLALADTVEKDTQIQAYTPADGYLKTTAGVYLKIEDVEEVILPSVTPITEQVIEPLPEKKDMTRTWAVLITIFLGCLFGTGTLGYYIRGMVEKKKWENDPFRYDKSEEGMNTNIDTGEEGEERKDSSAKKRTVLDNLLDKMKSKKAQPRALETKVNPRWIKGGVDDRGRTFYYEPEDIDPEGEPFYLDSQGKKAFYP